MAHANLSRRLAGQRLLLHGSSNERPRSQPRQRRQGQRLGGLETSSDSIPQRDHLDRTGRDGPRVIPVPSRSFLASHSIGAGGTGRLAGIARTSCFPMATARCGVRLHPASCRPPQPSFILLIRLRSMLLQTLHRGVGIPPQCVLHLRQHRSSTRFSCNHGHRRGERPGCLPTDAGPLCLTLRNLLNWPPELFVMSGFSWRPREATMRHSRTGRSPGGAHTRPACATTRVKAAKEAC